MPPQKRSPCQICGSNESKYTCAKCTIVYCSIPCYKRHKETSCSSPPATSTSSIGGEKAEAGPSIEAPRHAVAAPLTVSSGVGPEHVPAASDTSETRAVADNEKPATPPPQLRPLTSLRWPYVPDESAYPDPLKRDDPKPLQLPQYEAIATSPAVRSALATNPRLPALLRTLDAFRGAEREEALHRALGVSSADTPQFALAGRTGGEEGKGEREEDIKAMRELAEAVEAAVRGGKEGALGLDWGDGT